jgi:ATP-dependent DNA helicase PIF1
MLSAQQAAVVERVKAGKNCFITGAAGTGKSFLIKEIVRALRGRHALTAPTGMAAVNIGGITLHRWAGVGLFKDPVETYIKKHRASARRFDTPGWRIMNTRTLIIDEISMVSLRFFRGLDRLCRALRREPKKAFGGIQVILCGDFFQLPPVPDRICWSCSGRVDDDAGMWLCADPKEPECKIPAPGGGQYAFETCPDGATPWEDMHLETTILDKVFRQSDDPFIDTLHRVRCGKHTADDISYLQSLDRALPTEDGVIPTKLYPHNVDVDRENLLHYNLIKAPETSYTMMTSSNEKGMYMLDALRKGSQAADIAVYKVGTQVLLLANLDTENGLCNGTRGVVTSFCDTRIDDVEVPSSGTAFVRANPILPVVDYVVRGKKITRVVFPHAWTTDTLEGAHAQVLQIPLKHSWAFTVHKSQGMTLSKVEVDLKAVFSHGHAYVALSRASDPDGLQVRSLNPARITADPKVVTFYARGTKRKAEDDDDDALLAAEAEIMAKMCP